MDFELPPDAAVALAAPGRDRRPTLSLAVVNGAAPSPNVQAIEVGVKAKGSRRSRPKLPAGISRSRTVTLRMSEWEFQEIEAAAESEGVTNLSGYVRDIVLPHVRTINNRAGANLAALALGRPEIHEGEVHDGEI